MVRERPTTTSFYGWQILVFGEVGGALSAAGLVLPHSPLGTLPASVAFIVGMPAYVLGGPVAHWSHGDFTRGLVSLAANALVPLAMGLTGQTIACSPSDASSNCGTDGFLTGFAIALVTVPVADALILGWESVPVTIPFSARPVLAGVPVTRISSPPRRRGASAPKGHFQLGLTGTFSA